MRTWAFPLTNWVMGLSRPGGAVSPKLAECSTLYSVGLKSTSIIRPFALPARTSTVALVSCWRTTTSRSPAALALGAGALLEPAPELPVELIDVDGRVRGGSVHRGHRRRGRRRELRRSRLPVDGGHRRDAGFAPWARPGRPAQRQLEARRRGARAVAGADLRCAAERRPIAGSRRSRAMTHRMRGAGRRGSSPPRRRGLGDLAGGPPDRAGARSPVPPVRAASHEPRRRWSRRGAGVGGRR